MSIRAIFSFSSLTIACSLSAASPFLAPLEKGQHAVGVRVVESYDASRAFRYPFDLDGKPRSIQVTRPMQLTIWYPASKSSKPPMKFIDYVDLMATELDFSVPVDQRRAAGERALNNFPFMQNVTPEQRLRLYSLETPAVRDASPAPGRFPLIIASFGSPALYHGTYEYLASHGYVVAMLPRIPDIRGVNDSAQTRLDYDAKSRDAAFAIKAAAAMPQVDVTVIGMTGFSAGGRWAMYQAMHDPRIRAVVSLDSIMFFDDTEIRQMPSFGIDRFRAPLLHLIRREWVPRENSRLWDELQFSDRERIVFEAEGLDHFDFASLGYALVLAGARDDMKKPVEQVYRMFNEATRLFFDQHLKNSATAENQLVELKKTPIGGLTSARYSPSRRTPVEAQFREVLVEDLDRAIDAYRKAWKKAGAPPYSEETLNFVGYQLIRTGRVPDGLRLMALNAEAFPDSANVYDSLSDAYLAAGDEKKALELAEKCLALLPNDKSTAQRKQLIEASARDKVDRLRNKS